MEVLGQSITKAVENKRWDAIHLTKGGQPLSHLFFADDLLLMGSVSFSQARVMEHILGEFCAISGQKVNRSKSRVWFSPRTPTYLRHSICSGLGVQATLDLGMYLSAPLIHGRVTRRSYHHLVLKVRHRLATWKLRTLSRAACVLLIQTTLCAIPLYTMQMVALPLAIIRKLMKFCIAFFGVRSRDKGNSTPLAGPKFVVPVSRAALAFWICKS